MTRGGQAPCITLCITLLGHYAIVEASVSLRRRALTLVSAPSLQTASISSNILREGNLIYISLVFHSHFSFSTFVQLFNSRKLQETQTHTQTWRRLAERTNSSRTILDRLFVAGIVLRGQAVPESCCVHTNLLTWKRRRKFSKRIYFR
jgi:hypothetical protein